MKVKKLMRKQLDRQFQQLEKLKEYIEPQEGWVKLIRNALGMTTYQLAKRLGVSQSRIIKIESAARDHTIKINTLAQAAEAMNCRLMLVLVPETSLEDIIEKQAAHVAKKKVEYIAHSMKLENQSVDNKEIKEEIEELKQQLLQGPEKGLWDDD